MNWDLYFHNICTAIATKSPCMSRQIGAIIVRDKSIISTGFNGPARGIPHCGYERCMKDDQLKKLLNSQKYSYEDIAKSCPRKVLGFQSGTHMELCPAQHAEENCISNAARNGISTYIPGVSTILYMNTVIPCKNCFSTLINAGIAEIVVDQITEYDAYTAFIMSNSSIKIRQFNFEK
jgi:dCMP deaminase